MTGEWAICAEGLHKKFCRSLKRSMLYGSTELARRFAGLPVRRDALRRDEFWAVHDLSFEVKRGEAFGIIGMNGSGKSTLLRLVSGIFPPDRGRVGVRGRLGALIAVGAGFHPHFTGRENIFLNGAILGLTRSEILRRFDSILEFADIGAFIDSPVSSYSSGMKMRLGFAVAVHASLDVLLADEVLAVGDARFRKKCFEKILDLKRQGLTILFVSHSTSYLEMLCDRGLLLHRGAARFLGPMRECVKSYMGLIDEENKQGRPAPETDGTGNVSFSEVRVYAEGGDPSCSDIEFGKNIVIEFRYAFREKSTEGYQLRLGLKTHDGHSIQKFYFQEAPFPDGAVYSNERQISLASEGRAIVRILDPKISPQTLRLDLGLKSMRTAVLEGGFQNAAVFSIVEPRGEKFYFEYDQSAVTEFDYDIELVPEARPAVSRIP